jgi:TDG/mug DNA glycosylase family protein
VAVAEPCGCSVGELTVAWAGGVQVLATDDWLPLALARLHWALVPGAPVVLRLARAETTDRRGGAADRSGPLGSRWRPGDLADLLQGAGFTAVRTVADGWWVRASAVRAESLPDTVGPAMRVLVCGLNPSVVAARAGVGFLRRGNRFWPAALAAGLVTADRDPLHAFAVDGVGMTDLVKRATPNAAGIAPAEYRAGAVRVERLVRRFRPAVVLFVGLAGWRAAVDPRARAGLQPEPFGGRPAYVMPSTSGANASARVDDLIAHLRAVGELAGAAGPPGGGAGARARGPAGAG